MYGTMLLSTSMRMICCIGNVPLTLNEHPNPPKKSNSEFLHFHFGTLGGPINGWTERLPPRIFICMKFTRDFPSLPNKTWHVSTMKPSNAEKKKEKRVVLGHLNENDKQHMLLANLLILCRARPSEAWNAQTEQRYKASSSRKVRLQKSPRNIMKI